LVLSIIVTTRYWYRAVCAAYCHRSGELIALLMEGTVVITLLSSINPFIVINQP
jgi:hypothetical protein